MKKLSTLLIGLLVVLSSMRYGSTNTMASETTAMPSCSYKEDYAVYYCMDPLENNKLRIQASPFANDCGCGFGTKEVNHHTDVAESQIQQSKEKMSFQALIPYSFDLSGAGKMLLFFKLINAPPAHYLRNLATVQQLK